MRKCIILENKTRCSWANQNEMIKKYHDMEWGSPCHDNRKLFELLSLEVFQSGLNWNLILKKRNAFKEAFNNFDTNIICTYDNSKINELLKNKEIIRNRKKIVATINNAKIVESLTCSLNDYFWSFVDFKTIKHNYKNYHDIPVKTELSKKISNQMKKDGFKFTGPITIQSFIQSIGIVNDHETLCFKYNSY